MMQVDPVLTEVDVYLSQTLSSTLHLLQYPLRPAHLPLQPGSVQSVHVRSESNQVRVEVAISSNGENYSRSRGEGYARDADMASTRTAPVYQSGLMDCHSLTSAPQPPLGPRYVAGVLKDGELHLCPLQAIVQLRPSLQHLDWAATGRRRSAAAAEASTDGDTTESEGEEARPVTVKFARRDTGVSRSKRVSWSELSSKQSSEEGWLQVEFCPVTSQQANNERELLFAPDHLPTHSPGLSPDAYLDIICPMQDRSEERARSEPPGGAVSLSKLKALPVSKQVHDLLVSTGVLTLTQLTSLLQCGRGQLPAYLDALQQHGVLVQGCWVAGSHLLYPSDHHRPIRSARDYLLYCFNQGRCIARKDIAILTKVPHETVRQVLASLTSGTGLVFKLPTDADFMHKFSHIVRQQEEKWRQRLGELKTELNLPREQHKSPGGSEDTQKLATRKGKIPVSVKVEPADEAQMRTSSPPTTPDHHQPHLPQPMDTSTQLVKQERIQETEINASDYLEKFCCEVLARGVHSLSDITSRLRGHQGILEPGHPIGTAVVTEALVQEALGRVAAIEVGQPCGVRLFALHRNQTTADQFRSVVLKLFKSHRWLRKKMLLDTIERECGRQPDSKEITTILKELAYSKGSQWYLLGT